MYPFSDLGRKIECVDIWEVLERGAVLALERALATSPIDRSALENGLRMFAVGKNKDPYVPLPAFDIFNDSMLVGLVEALLSGNRIAA
jgi:hypothetical protein